MSTKTLKPFLTKKGEHGTLYRYRVTYRYIDPGAPDFTWRCWAYSEDHAREKFEADGDDWSISKIERMREVDGGPRS